MITSEDEAPRLVRDEIDRWHAADTGGDAGKEADFVVVDPADMPPLHAAVAHGVRSGDATAAADPTLFAVLMGTRESSVAETYVQGRRLSR